MFPENNLDFDLKRHTVLLALAGSKSYGTDVPESDTDYKGVMIPPFEYFTSPFKNIEQFQWKGDSEGTIYSIKKFATLAAKANPNVIECLFVKPEHILHITKAGRVLIENRELFLSQLASRTFTGYAFSQLKRIKTHREWLLNPPKCRPVRSDFGLSDEKLISGDQIKAAEALARRALQWDAPWLLEADNQHKEVFWEGAAKAVNLLKEGIDWQYIEDKAITSEMRSLGYDSNFIEYIKKEKAYRQAVHHYKQYSIWKESRNAERAKLEAEHGFDTKHAMHLVRLLKMGRELVETGKMNVFREDADELRKIRLEGCDYDELVSWANKEADFIFKLVKEGKSPLPKLPDYTKIEKVCSSIIQM